VTATTTTVNPALTPNPRTATDRPVVENTAYAGFLRRVVMAYGRRVAAGDVEALRDLLALAVLVDRAADVAVAGLRGFGYSWADIATRIGITRQAAHQRWGGEDQ